MNYFISRVPPIFDNWQFKGLKEGISRKDWLEVVEKIKTLNQLEDENRFKLVSIQNPEFNILMFHSEKHGGAIGFSRIPDRYAGELIQYLYQICYHLGANIYDLGEDGKTADKFFSSTKEMREIKEYSPVDEKKVTDIEISEMLGLMSIPTENISEVASFLKLEEDEFTTWEEAVQICYNSGNYMIRTLQGWTIVIGQLKELISKFQNEINQDEFEEEQFIELLKLISSKFDKVSYDFNASRYSYFEQFIAEKGKLIYKYIHGDGEEEIEGEPKGAYFSDFAAFCYDESILKGIQLYK